MLRELDLRQSRAGTQLLEPGPRPLAQFLGFRRLLGELDLSAHRRDPALPSELLDYRIIVAQLRPRGEAASPATSASGVRGCARSADVRSCGASRYCRVGRITAARCPKS